MPDGLSARDSIGKYASIAGPHASFADRGLMISMWRISVSLHWTGHSEFFRSTSMACVIRITRSYLSSAVAGRHPFSDNRNSFSGAFHGCLRPVCRRYCARAWSCAAAFADIPPITPVFSQSQHRNCSDPRARFRLAISLYCGMLGLRTYELHPELVDKPEASEAASKLFSYWLDK